MSFLPLTFAAVLASIQFVSTPPPSPTRVEKLEFVAPDTVKTAPVRADSVIFGKLADGALYRRIKTSSGAIMHVIDVDTRRGLRVESVKASDAYDGLETLSDLYERTVRDARRDGDTVLAAINAGPWHPEHLAPIGPLVVNGEIVELGADDAWSSLLLYSDGRSAITRDRIAGQFVWRHRSLDIRTVNRRVNEETVALYNPMYGGSVPANGVRSDVDIVRDALASREVDDTGIDFEEEEIDSAGIVRAYRSARLRDERDALKIAVRRLSTARRDWLGEPRLNDTMWTAITIVDTGTVAIPHDGYVLTFGASEELLRSARVGDTVRLIFQVAHNGIGVIRDVVPGYPQLLFGGKATAEPDFVQGPAASIRGGAPGARTGIGISEDGATMYLVAVEAPTNARSGGMTMDELATRMRGLGAHNALALEGHGSTTMVVNYETVTHGSGAPAPRRISSGLIVKKKRVR